MEFPKGLLAGSLLSSLAEIGLGRHTQEAATRPTGSFRREIGGSRVSDGTTDTAKEPGFDRRLALLLAMAMFVLVFDTSLMNVSIS